MTRWYQDAVFYQALVSSFYAPDDASEGTLRGVEAKLDYLNWLGINCIWLPPFYASPRRDDGYDIADYRAVDPAYGTMADFESLLAAAHERGIRIITDLALNHTSSDHPWFQASRQDPDGPYGDYYVWGDDPHRYPEIRVIFTDVEDSNWSWDEQRGQYYFHRFYSHQPDLNYDNPKVHEEVFDIIDFWMAKGLDGFRLDAIPYLYERDGLGGESLPETIAFIESIRRFLDEHYPDAIMLAEANQPVPETMEFFGTAQRPRFHMVFNFPLMPRLYHAFAIGEATPVTDILAQLSSLPEGAQWGTFIRNHDELTLEMVTAAERELFYQHYAPQPQHRAHLGIARRLAPLLNGNRSAIELFFALLMAIPGSPFIYYGDEIGMGDDTSLPDRDAVRTPMQWDPHTGDLRRPVVRGEYGPEHVNVADQLADPDSLLHHIRNLIATRPTGDYEPYIPGEQLPGGLDHTAADSTALPASVLAFYRGETLCLFNFAADALEVPITARGVTVTPEGEPTDVTITLAGYGYVFLPI